MEYPNQGYIIPPSTTATTANQQGLPYYPSVYNPGYYYGYPPPPPPPSLSTQSYHQTPLHNKEQNTTSSEPVDRSNHTDKNQTLNEDMELDSPSEGSHSIVDGQEVQEGSNQYNQSGQYDQSYQNQSGQYDQSYQNQSGQYNQSYQNQSGQYGQSYQNQSGQYDQSYQNQSGQYDQSYQNQSGQYDQSYQNQPVQYDQSYQNQPVQYDQSYQQVPYMYPYYNYPTLTPPTTMGGAYTPQFPLLPWPPPLPSYPSLNTEKEWSPWTSQRRRGRGRGRGALSRLSAAVKPTTPSPSSSSSSYSAVPPPSTTTTTTTTTGATDSSSTPMSSSDWPPGLQDYMVKSFAACGNEEEKTQVEQYLKVEINEMFRDKRVWQIDWSAEPLPLEKLKRQAQKRKSRWDTPSPLTESTHSATPDRTPPSVTPQSQRGKKRKKGKRGGRGGKFFIDRTGDRPVGGAMGGADLSEEDRLRVGQRSQRFAKGSEGNKMFKSKLSIEELLKTVSVSTNDETDSYCIEGTSSQLEKRYLRLTAAPHPSTVRPEPILRQSLTYVLDKSNSKEYNYICEQMKSIRQDLTIQGIRNDFTVEVYETHARIALKNGDWSEFNQCQSQLGVLYDEGLPGHKPEFMAYRVLYHMLTNETADFIEVFKKITADMMSDPAIVHSMKLREAWSSDNYSKFFRLYKVTPNCGRHLVELFIDRERKSALRIMTKAYRPTLCVNYISSVLSFPTLSECQDFLSSCDLVMDHSKSSLNCRDSYSKLTS